MYWKETTAAASAAVFLCRLYLKTPQNVFFFLPLKKWEYMMIYIIWGDSGIQPQLMLSIIIEWSADDFHD